MNRFFINNIEFFIVRFLITVFIFIVSLFFQLHAAKRAELVIDVQTGQVLHSFASTQKRYPASVTKMMTLYLIFDALETGRLSPDTKIKMTHAIKKRGKRNGGITFKGIKAGQSMKVKDIIYTLITKSANDIAIMISSHLAGSEKNFAQKMTQTAKQLGMKKTHFTNASGLPDRRQYTTAQDMAVLGIALMRDFPSYYKYFSLQKVTVHGHTLNNHNKLLGKYNGLDGFKTGYIKMSGFNLVASAQRGNRRIIGVVFGGKTSKKRNQRMKEILNIGWKKIANGTGIKRYVPHRFQNIAQLNYSVNPLESKGYLNTRFAKVNLKKQKSDLIQQASMVKPLPIKVTQQASNTASLIKPVKPSPIMPLPVESSLAKSLRSVHHSMTMPLPVKNTIKDKPFYLSMASGPKKSDEITASIMKAQNNKSSDNTLFLSTSSLWKIQVGAFSKKNTATNYLHHLKSSFKNILSNADSSLEKISNKAGNIYRARFTGLTADAAHKTCRLLIASGKQCMLIQQKS